MELCLERDTLDLVSKVQIWYKDFDIFGLYMHAVKDNQNLLYTWVLLMVLLILYKIIIITVLDC